MGSGTTAIEASRFARKVFGIEVDPYARLIATVSTTRHNNRELSKLEVLIKEIEEAAKSISPDVSLEPNLKNVEYWFDEENYTNLTRLKTSIFAHTQSGKQRDFFLTAFGDIIRACSKAERQSLKPYISTKYIKTPKPVFQEFAKIAPRYLNAISTNRNNLSKAIIWAGEDATNFDLKNEVSIAISSPPYINAMDYTRCIKLESSWIGTGNDDSLRNVKTNQLGENARQRTAAPDEQLVKLCEKNFGSLLDIDKSRYQTAVAFFADMKKNLICVERSLKRGGTYFVIVGNSKIRGLEIPTHEIIAEIAVSVGFSWDRYFYYKIKDHRTSIPRGTRGGKIEVEHVMGLKKN
tara:strand:+ start:2773 stop:3822 length:1050 start_codon:yes stop_codon:yes gene_type:complete